MVLNQLAASPATIEPTMKPENITATISARRRRGEYSEVSAIVLGSAPPTARPVAKRNRSSIATDVLNAVIRLKSPRSGMQNSRMERRQERSASGATNSAPHNNPNNPREKSSQRSRA